MAEQSKTTRWSKTAVTDAGTNLLTEFAAGRLLTITSAFGSVGAPGENLVELTELHDGRAHPLTIESVTKTDENVTVCIQVTSVGNQEPYKLEQIGIFAAAGGSEGQGGSAEDEKLLMVIEDAEDENGSKGVTVPAETDQIYAFKLYAVLTITNKERLEVSVSSAGIATVGAIEEAVKKHDADPTAHRSLSARMSAAEVALNGGETILGAQSPDTKTKGVKGQHYIDRDGTEFVCTDVTEEGYIWEAWENVDKSAFAAQPKLTGLPGQVVGFDAAGGPVPVRGWSNPQLLVNWDFRNPVNRNGLMEYTTFGYTIDRWTIRNGTTMTISDDGIVFSTQSSGGGFNQSIEFPRLLFGKIVTLSILIDENTVNEGYIRFGLHCANDSTSHTHPTLTKNIYGETGLISITGTVDSMNNYSNLNFGAIIFSSGIFKIRAIKLELGDHQTLANQNEDGGWEIIDPPNYDLQYALCSLYSPVTGEWVGYQHSNLNLADNAYWASKNAIIDQRGQGEYKGNAYTIDRWIASNSRSIVSVEDGFVRLRTNGSGTAFMRQRLEFNLPPGTYTLSVLLRASGSGYIGINEYVSDTTALSKTFSGSDDWQLVQLTIPVDASTTLKVYPLSRTK